MYQMFLSFIFTMLTIVLVLFNVPYWEGKKMYDISNNGLWQLIYYGLAEVGHKLYQGVEIIAHEITLQIIGKTRVLDEKRAHPVLINVINLLTYCLAMYILANIYEVVCAIIVGQSTGIEYFSSGDTMRHEDSIFTLTIGMCSFVKVILGGIVGGDLNILVILEKILFLIVWNIFYYSIMYGMLIYKVKEIKITSFFNWNNVNSITGQESLAKQFYIKLNESIFNWLSEKTIFKNLFLKNKEQGEIFNFKAFSAFSVFIFICIYIAKLLGINTMSAKDFFLMIVDELQIVDILFSFVITFGIALLSKKGIVLTVEALPDRYKEEIKQKSKAAEKLVGNIENYRTEWCRRNDNIENADNATFFMLRTRHRNRQTSTTRNQQSNNAVRESQQFQEENHVITWGESEEDHG